MRRMLLASTLLLAPRIGLAQDHGQSSVGACIASAADVYQVPAAVLVALLSVEGGSLHHVTPNTNGTVDIGPMQVNEFWLPSIARHWHASQGETYGALRDDFCPNIAAGAWILRQSMDEAHGDLWEGVALYHSHTSFYKTDYLRKVLAQVRRLIALAAKSPAAVGPASPPG